LQQIYTLCGRNIQFLDALAKLLKAAISFVTSVCPAACMKILGSHWADFHEIWLLIFMKFGIWVFFENLPRRFKFH